tara:strand:+ start:200 stop:1108 length:909 start_codon:yes stop_codon:yes gene_type:complete
MNFSEYTLVSFGDSFTFGQDIVPHYVNQDWGTLELQEKYKKTCNGNSYTQVIADSFGFKDSLNFGVLAGSNERSLTLLEPFLRSNPTLKIFVLFNFTSSSRFLQFLKIDGKREYDEMNIHTTAIESNLNLREGIYTGISKRSLNNQYTYWRNSIQDMYNHIKDRRMLYYMLYRYNVPHATFDIMNDTDYRMLRNNPINYIHRNDGYGIEFLYNDDERYVFKERDFLKSYHQELVDKSPLLTHIGMDYLSGQRNFISYINNMARNKHNDDNYYLGEDNGHWNSEGHREVAKLIEKFINEKYDN